MKSKEIVLTLGYIAIFCVALYLVFGLLKMSGQGLSSIVNGPLIEGHRGMDDKQRERFEGDIEKANTSLEKMFEGFEESELGKAFLNADDVTGFDEFQENIVKLVNYNLEMKRNFLISNLINISKGKKQINLHDKYITGEMDAINRLFRFKKFLEEHENVQI